MIWRRKTKYIDWNEYKNKIELLSDFWFRQSVRKRNVEMI